MQIRSTLLPRVAWFLALFPITLLGQMRLITHVTAPNGGFATNIILTNATDSNQDYRLTPYGVDGQMLSVVTGTIASGETRNMSAADIFGGTAVSHFSLDENSQVSLTIAYQAADGANSPAHVGPTTKQSMRWRIYPGTQDDVLDGLAVVNMGSATEIYARQVTYDGDERQRASLGMVATNAKALYLFDDFVRSADTYYEIFADAPLALTALRFANGIPGARFFWETEALCLPPLVETPMDPRIGQKAVFPPNTTYDVRMGEATIIDERTIRIDNFSYSGSGPDVRFYLGKDGDYLNGFPISDKISGGAPFNNATITLTLPEGRTLDDFNGISIWCTAFLLDFSSDIFK